MSGEPVGSWAAVGLAPIVLIGVRLMYLQRMGNTAPVAIFIFNRPEHLKATLATLLRCDGCAGRPAFRVRRRAQTR